MIRPARHMDAFALVDILVERQKDSRYAGRVAVDEPYARKFLSSLIQRHGGTNEGGSFVMVSEDSAGQVEAFVAGALDRIYMIGDRLGAQDVFLIGRKGCPPRALTRLFDEYVAWAASNPKVLEIGASHGDVIEGGDAFGPYFERAGFIKCGTLYRRDNAPIGEELAA